MNSLKETLLLSLLMLGFWYSIENARQNMVQETVELLNKATQVVREQVGKR